METNNLSINIYKATGMMHGSRDRVRELIRIRDKHICQICGKKWKNGQRRFDVHHLDCVKEKTLQCDKYEEEKDNMLTLCHKCHLSLPEHRLTMKISAKNVKRNRNANTEKIIELRKQGKTHRIIGETFNITRQRVSQILKSNLHSKGE